MPKRGFETNIVPTLAKTASCPFNIEQLAVFYDSSIQKSVARLAPDNVVALELGPEGQEPLQDQ